MSNQITPNPSKPTTGITPIHFPEFVHTFGNLPTSYKDSMTYYETLVWLCRYLEETVIPAVNTNNDAVLELQELYGELNAYVTTYFDNLDVQEEINKHLDDLVRNGTLTNLLGEYVDPKLEEVRAELNLVQDEVSAMAGGGPAGVYDTIADLQQADPDHTRIYLVKADGEWYYYNNSTNQWKNGGVYQATGIGNGEVTAINLDASLQNNLKINEPSITWNSGHYRTTYGTLADHPLYTNSSPIELKQGETLYYKCNAGNSIIGVICNVTSNGEPTFLNSDALNVASVSNVLKIYSYTAPFNCYVSLSYLTANGYDYVYIDKASKNENLINDILGYKIPQYSIIKGNYRNGNQIIANPSYCYTTAIELKKDETIKFHARGEATAVSLLTLVNVDNDYISTLLQTSGTKEYDVEFTAPQDCYVSLCSQLRLFSNIYVQKIKQEEKKEDYAIDLFSSFLKVGVIGDSLASGEAVANNEGSLQFIDNFDYSWGQFMARNHGFKCVNFSRGGATTRTWLNSDFGLAKAQLPENLCNAYIIGLGVNDSGSVTLGTINDIHLDDFTQNADTFYGNYGKIIGNIKALQPKAKIFLLTQASNYGAYLDAIVDIAGLYEHDVYLVNLYEDYSEEYLNPEGFIMQNKREGHYNAVAYNYMSEILYKAFNKIMINKPEEFKQIEFIGTNYSYN